MLNKIVRSLSFVRLNNRTIIFSIIVRFCSRIVQFVSVGLYKFPKNFTRNSLNIYWLGASYTMLMHHNQNSPLHPQTEAHVRPTQNQDSDDAKQIPTRHPGFHFKKARPVSQSSQMEARSSDMESRGDQKEGQGPSSEEGCFSSKTVPQAIPSSTDYHTNHVPRTCRPGQ